MIASKYLRSVCCGLFLLAGAGRACASVDEIKQKLTKVWKKGLEFNISLPIVVGVCAGTFIAGSIFNALASKKTDKKKPVRVCYPSSKFYEVADDSPKNANLIYVRSEKRKLSNLVNLVKDLEKFFIADVNERSSDIRVMQQILRNELGSGASDSDIENLKLLAKNLVDSVDGDKMAELLIKTYREMKEQKKKVRGLLRKYKKKSRGV